MHAASCRVLALADGVRLEAEIFEHSVELHGLREEGELVRSLDSLEREAPAMHASWWHRNQASPFLQLEVPRKSFST